MTLKRFWLIFLVIAVAVGALSGDWSSAYAAKVSKTKTVSKDIFYQKDAYATLGRGGVSFPSSAYTATVVLTRAKKNKYPSDKNLSFMKQLMEVRIYDYKGAEIKQVYGIIYVHFNLNKAQRAAYNRGDLGIYYYNSGAKEWVACPVEVVVKTKNKPNGRLACIIENFGVYGLATKR